MNDIGETQTFVLICTARLLTRCGVAAILSTHQKTNSTDNRYHDLDCIYQVHRTYLYCGTRYSDSPRVADMEI